MSRPLRSRPQTARLAVAGCTAAIPFGTAAVEVTGQARRSPCL
ncbi:MAG: hypothetical protein R3B96_00590 [Pirellulaceae bacterium]